MGLERLSLFLVFFLFPFSFLCCGFFLANFKIILILVFGIDLEIVGSFGVCGGGRWKGGGRWWDGEVG